MEITKHQWREGAATRKGIDADAALRELERIENLYGSLTPENLLQEAEKKKNILHNFFQWDNEKAAHQFRLQQARMLINDIEVVIISDGEETSVPVYEIIKTDETRSYKSIEKFTEADIEQVRAQAIRELNFWKNKLGVYNKFTKAAKKLNEAVDLLK